MERAPVGRSTSDAAERNRAGRDELCEQARTEAALSQNYLVLTVASCVIATFGLLENSVAVIIGAMVVAPLIGPIQSFAYAALAPDVVVLRTSLVTAGVGTLIAIATSTALGAVLALPSYGPEVLARTKPSLLDLGIAIAAGMVAGFAKIRPSIANTIAGTAIAVALMPPLCVIGLSLARAQWSHATGAALLFGTNFFGIALACMIVYIAARVFRTRSHVGLVTTLGVTAALAVPLAASLFALVRDAHLEGQIRHELVSNTVTFRDVTLVSARFDWYETPVRAELAVSAARTVTSTQVRLLEKFLLDRTGQHVRLVLRVTRYRDVTDRESDPPAAATP